MAIDLVDVPFLLGKMDGLRFPPHSLNVNNIRYYGYRKEYIEELLALRDCLIRDRAEPPKKVMP